MIASDLRRLARRLRTQATQSRPSREELHCLADDLQALAQTASEMDQDEAAGRSAYDPLRRRFVRQHGGIAELREARPAASPWPMAHRQR